MTRLCPAAKALGYNATPCPLLLWEDELATCSLVASVDHPNELLGIGAGCCITAVAVNHTGVGVNFAALPPALKRQLAQRAALGRLSAN